MRCFVHSAALCVAGPDLAVNAKQSLEYTRPGEALLCQPRGPCAESGQVTCTRCFDRLRERLWRILFGPELLIMQNNTIHVAPANAYHRGAASLTFERDQPKRFLRPRMNE